MINVSIVFRYAQQIRGLVSICWKIRRIWIDDSESKEFLNTFKYKNMLSSLFRTVGVDFSRAPNLLLNNNFSVQKEFNSK